MADADELLEQWLSAGQELLKARRGSERERELEERLARLEGNLSRKPADEQEEAFEELTEEELALVKKFRAERPAITPDPAADTPDIESKKKTRPGRQNGKAYTWTVGDDGKVQRLDLPHVYSGDDEPDEVELPGDEDEADAA